MLPFGRADLERLFPEPVWKRAEHLVIEGAVVDVAVERDGKSVTGRIKGERRTPYLTRVKIANGRGGRVRISSTCTCLVYSECEHAAATLLGVLDKNAAPEADTANVAIDPELEAWINAVNGAVRSAPQEERADGSDCVLYLLEPTQRSWRDSLIAQPIAVNLLRARRLRPGVYGREQPLAVTNLVADDPPRFVTLKDHLIGRLLGAVTGNSKRLTGLGDAEALMTMLETGRCHWRNFQGKPLGLGEARRGRFGWRFDGEGQQHVTCTVEEANPETLVVALGQPWYVDLQNHTCGRVETGVPDRIARYMLQAPGIPAATASVARQRLVPSGEVVPLPEPLRRRERLEIKPVPILHLHCPSVVASRGTGWKKEEQEVDLPLARILFDYGGAEVGWQDGRSELNHVKDNRLLVLPRDALAEVQAIERLNRLGLQPLGPTGLGRFAPDHCRQDFTFEEDEDDDVSLRWVQFNHEELPALQKEGWRITFSDAYPYQVCPSTAAWQVEITESGIDWFDLDLGIEIDGSKVPLLPVLLDLFRRAPDEMNPAALEAFGDEPVYGTLPDGRLLPIPASRLKAMLEALYDLFASARIDPEQPLRLRRADALRLASLEAAMPDGQLQWSGGERLREMARRLQAATDLPPVVAPNGLKATLRPYQLQGLRWLQFLSTIGLSGVLADDMGLGKTLQTLAHILTEKEAGRLRRPCLVVAPTSLIPTWRNETRRFAPDLDILVLHGNDRHDYFTDLDSQDIVLTSYALLIRDAELLLPRQWRMVVLDESQAIKNPSTKLARTANLLQADLRLALSGTPMENHLGELWSVYNFLMPGFLGDRETFRRVFRNQIEKEGDVERQALLADRVRPFMLRRKKEEVASELPPKTEVLREVDLTDEQRDLYETVRLSMHRKVRDEIQARGLARSNIAILEALLKLRQVCCDPRLLKGGAGGHVGAAASAKFELLMEMLPAMVENGRRIIVFSQFVEMLELIEKALVAEKLDFVKLTGATRDRETPVRRFQAGEVPIFLISLKAGGVGLTLTRADTVIHYDPWWNPAVEAQATDRAHRIGQDKTVFVYKLIASGTVEDKMVELQARKKALIEGVLTGSSAGLTFGEDDLEALFAPLPKL
ncbi:MAG TPA: SNF2-related protein [Geminicoccaceae bacterium]|nr:SNF2-related protein [Geminicoccaceae bacterium]